MTIEELKDNLSPRFSYETLKYILKEYARRYKEIESYFPKEVLMLDILNENMDLKENSLSEKTLENRNILDNTVIQVFKNSIINTDISFLSDYNQSVINRIKSRVLSLENNPKKLKKYLDDEVYISTLYSKYVHRPVEYYKHDLFLDLSKEKPNNYDYKLIINPKDEDVDLVLSKLMIKFEENNFYNYLISKNSNLKVNNRDKIYLYAKKEDILKKYLLFLDDFIKEEQDLVSRFDKPTLTLPLYKNIIGFQEDKNETYLLQNTSYLVNEINTYLLENNIKIDNLNLYEDEIIQNILDSENKKVKLNKCY